MLQTNRTKQRKKRHIALLLCICFVVVPLFAEIFIVIHADHACIGNGCHRCEQIHDALILLEKMGTVIVYAFVAIMGLRVILLPIKYIFIDIIFSNLIILKIRMNN